MTPRTLFEKVWHQHLVVEPANEPSILYIDLHLVHEVTSPQAFDGLRMAGRTLRRPDRTVATVDHRTGYIFSIPSPTARSKRCARTARSSASNSTTCRHRSKGSYTLSGRSSDSQSPG